MNVRTGERKSETQGEQTNRMSEGETRDRDGEKVRYRESKRKATTERY